MADSAGAVESDHRCRAGEREITVTPTDFLKGPAGVPPRAGHVNFRQELSGLESGCHVRQKKIVGCYESLTDIGPHKERRAERYHCHRQFCGSKSMREASSHSAAVTNLRMTD